MAQVAHLKGPEKEGKRDPVYFATHVNYIEGLENKLKEYNENAQTLATNTIAGITKLYNYSGTATDGTITQAAITENFLKKTDQIGVDLSAYITANNIIPFLFPLIKELPD